MLDVLSRSEIVGYLAAPNRELGQLRRALDRLQSDAWYIHATATGQLLFRNVENLNAKLESYAGPMLREARETELRERLKEMLDPKLGACYQDVLCLPPLDEVQITQEQVSLIVFRPSTPFDDIKAFWEHQQFKNRVLFLTGTPTGYERVLDRSASLRAIRQIIREFREQGVRETEPQFVDALDIQDREKSQFYLACRETFQRLYYPARPGLIQFELDPKYVANKYEGEQQIIAALAETYKYREDTSADSPDFRRALEERLWPEGQKEVPWADMKRRAATNPSWVWYHPRALDDLREELLQRDIWRDIGGGYVQRGPFPKPRTGVMPQELNRDPSSGKVTLRVRPLHGDTVHFSNEGLATTSSPKLEGYDMETDALKVSFLAVDSTGQHETGEPHLWTNTIELKYRFFQQGDERMCELQAIPSGEIRYTVDGSSPETSGQLYTGPFPIPVGTTLILAQAQGQSIVSRELQIEVAEDIEEFRVEASKPALWRRQWNRDSTAETYEFLELAEKHGALLGGPKIDVGKDSRWVSFATDEQTFRSSAEVRELASLFTKIIPAGVVALTTETLKFNRGQDLEDLVADLRTSLEADEVEQ